MKNKRKILIFVLSLLLLTQVAIAGPQNVEFEATSINNTEELIRKKVNFINPIDGFTMYAFMNYTGYDAENHTEYHPVREGLRNDLIKMDINISRPNYYSEWPASYGLELDLPGFIGWLGEDPNFKIDPKFRKVIGMNVHGNLYDLDLHLTEFYREADIETLYNKYNPYYEQIIEQNQDQVYDPLIRMVDYFNLDIATMRDFDIFINLLDMNWRGYMVDSLNVDSNTRKPYLLQIGPTPQNNINIHNVVHEFAHIFEVPIIRSKPIEFEKLEKALINEYGIPKSDDYRTWDKIVDESIVRAMTVWVMNQGRQQINIEMSQGFVMTEYIYNRISDFDNNPNLDFETWLLSVMEDYANEIYDFDYGNGKDYADGYKDGFREDNIDDNDNDIVDGWTKLPTIKNLPINKSWEIEFNRSFVFDEIYSISILKANKFLAHDITLDSDNKRVIVDPVAEYDRNNIYDMRIFLKNGNKYKMKFETVN